MSNDELATADDYFKAFEALQKEGLAEKPIALLQAHFNAPNHTATMQQLADAVGYANYGGANMQYGTLGRRVGEKLGISKPSFWIFVLVEFEYAGSLGRDLASGHQTFVLRHPVIEALTRLAILPKRNPSKRAMTGDDDPVEAASPTSKVIAAILCNPEVETGEVQLAAMEGRHYLAEAKFRQRNRALIEEKKRRSDGRCSVCEFDFKATYKGIERDLLVGHHVEPIGKRTKGSKTTLGQIDVLCPNCHAAVHSQDPPLTAAELRTMLIS
jgi:5-methylcytosine-specific restriction endonuclease McrA